MTMFRRVFVIGSRPLLLQALAAARVLAREAHRSTERLLRTDDVLKLGGTYWRP